MELVRTPERNEPLKLEYYPIDLMIECLFRHPHAIDEAIAELRTNLSILVEKSPTYMAQTTCVTILASCMSQFVSNDQPSISDFPVQLDTMIEEKDGATKLAIYNQIAQVRYERMAATGQA